jgi:hypothetical protein
MAVFWLQALLLREGGDAMRVTWADLCVMRGVRWRGYTTLAALV